METISIKKASERLNVSESTIANYVRKGLIRKVPTTSRKALLILDDVVAIEKDMPELSAIHTSIDMYIRTLKEERDRLADTIAETREEIARIAGTPSVIRNAIDAALTQLDIFCEITEGTVPARQKNILKEMLQLRPVDDIARSYDLTPEQIKRLYAKAQRTVENWSATKIQERILTAEATAEQYRKKAETLANELTRLEKYRNVSDNQQTGTTPKEIMDFLDTPIEKTWLSTRTIRRLLSAEIKSVRELLARDREDIYGISGFGAVSRREVECFLNAYGLHWKCVNGHGALTDELSTETVQKVNRKYSHRTA